MSLFDEHKEPVIFEFGVDETARAYLLETARWTKFMAIIGFIITGIFLVAGLIFSMNTDGLNGAATPGSYMRGYTTGMIIVYILFAMVYIYPTVCLMRFSTNIKAALLNNDVHLFNMAMKYQRNMWRFMGILMIVIMAIYGLGIAYLAMLSR